MHLLIGTLTRMGGAGIGLARLENDHLQLLWSDHRLTDPNWLSVSADGRVFTTHSNGTAPTPGQVSELMLSEQGMKIISTRDTCGSGPCYLAFADDRRFMLCANYGTGNLAVFRLEKEGIGERIQLITHSGSGPHPVRQKSAHIHQITRIPALPDCFCAVDLGLDRLFVYQQGEDGKLTELYTISVPAGQGPRHMAYTRTGDAYLITELGNRIYPVCFGRNGGSVVGDGVSTLRNPSVQNTAAALWVSPDDGRIWASNRGEGTLVEYALPGLEKRADYSLFGMQPRDFCLLEDGLTVAACQDAGLTVLRDGKITDTLEYPGAVRVLEVRRID